MTMTIANKICDAAPRNSQLLSILLQTQYATIDLDQQRDSVARIEERLLTVRQRIKQLDEKRESGLKKHKSYRDSVVKKFAYRLSGHSDEFAARKDQGEQEYFEVLQQGQQAKEEEDRLLAEKVEALTVRTSLEQVVKRRTEAQNQLDALYDSIFHGPTPEFPEEDELERKAEEALSIYHFEGFKAASNREILETLKAARDQAVLALNEIVEALRGGILASSMTEKKRLETAETALAETYGLVRMAQEMSPTVPTLPVVEIRVKLITGEAYDNPWGRMAVHDRIRDWRTGAQRCVTDLDKQLVIAKSHYDETCKNMTVKSKALNSVKQALQSCRTEIFVIVESAELHAEPDDGLPPY
ncbi:hypothetical protein SCUP234_00935 [Seiridium cupressi]